MRTLTTRFFSSKLAKYEKATGKGVMDLLDIGNLEINKICVFIKLGNTYGPGVDEDEAAYTALDNYLAANESNSLITAYFELLDDLDHDIKIFKTCGLSIDDIKAEFTAKVAETTKPKLESVETTEVNTETSF